ncbi:MAG TPA: RNA polymerase sigma factor [Steroidobacteraceae bacterium]|nr:RNA polymerase sigma factor [Steroidobacteraceae bacterium]
MTKFQPQAPENAARIAEGDLALCRDAERNGPNAFEPIMRRYNQRLYRLALSFMGEAGEAEDVLQESYVRAFRSLPSFGGRSDLGTWLATIVRNQAVDRLRQRRSRQATVSLDAELRSEGDTRSVLETARSEALPFDPEANLAREELRRALEHAIAALPEQFRSVFMLRQIEGLTLQETADYLDVPVATVKTRDHRARALLRQELDLLIDDATVGAFQFLGIRCDRLVAQVIARLQQ